MNSPKSILISGCSSGIGHCVAHGLKQRGYRVFATARKSEDVEKLKEEGLESYRLDLADSASIEQGVKAVLERTGGELFALFNNGAYGQPGAVEDLRRDVLRAQFETNLFGTQELTNRIIPVMRRQGYGRIIHNSSVLGLVALPYRGAYNASKFALEGLTDTLRLELHGSGIQVALIEPGPIESRFRANAYAMFKKNIDRENSAHRDYYQGVEKRLAQKGHAQPFTLPPEAVLKKVIHALESPRPKRRYYVTFPTHLFGVARRILPVSLLDKILLKVSGGENR
ncbi:oxidoreductase [Candidatus Tenderia electrophaga]|jgi:NAD(P)-dependent dehydrogenase (short-subunit alcohol dehydrogenase family)|uniref:Oxidoreductase n=1 Tax=Candidatus Tenderia electrophaga TaxID=1748243 RepID=A0A0S2TBL2_9GAMM|nr:oxidoreductase [Candidatus Tenderia electrophaga]